MTDSSCALDNSITPQSADAASESRPSCTCKRGCVSKCPHHPAKERCTMNLLPMGSSGMTAISADTTIDSSPAVRLLDCGHKVRKAATCRQVRAGQAQVPGAHLLVVVELPSGSLCQQLTWCKPQLSVAGSLHAGGQSSVACNQVFYRATYQPRLQRCAEHSRLQLTTLTLNSAAQSVRASSHWALIQRASCSVSRPSCSAWEAMLPSARRCHACL